MLDKKIAAFTKIVAMLPDKPNAAAGITSEQLKVWFDSASEELRVNFNALIDEIVSSAGASGIGNLPVEGISGTNLQDLINSLVIIVKASDVNSTQALSTANTASNNATAAVNTANTASNNATTALNTANNAFNKATSVETDYNTLKPQLEQAVEDVADKASVEYVNSAVAGAAIGQVPGGSLTDFYLSDDPTDIKARVALTNNQVEVKTAGGTATAVTLSDFGLGGYFTGLKVTFIASADNGGEATTINIDGKGAKSIYKPASVIAPNFKAGRAYTIYYSGTSFFWQASAEGNAVVADVLASKTFSNDDDTGLVGTMPNRGAVAITPSASAQAIQAGYHNGSGSVAAVVVPVANVLTGTTIAGQAGTMVNRSIAYQDATAIDGTNNGVLFLRPPVGYYDGVGALAWVKRSDANFLASNIKKSVALFGKTGTFGAISSTQKGSTSFNGSVAFIDVTVTSFVLANSIVRIRAVTGANSVGNESTFRIRAVNNTTIRIQKEQAVGSRVVYWEVITFDGVKSKQSGDDVALANGGTVTITTVDPLRSLVFSSSTSGGGSTGTVLPDSGFDIAATQLTFRTSYGGSILTNWQVIEFN
jgi:hypothetical protein